MKSRVLTMVLGFLLISAQASAQARAITGVVTDDQGAPIVGASVVGKGTSTAALTNTSGQYSIRATTGQVLQFSYIGTATIERTVGTTNVISVQLNTQAISLQAV